MHNRIYPYVTLLIGLIIWLAGAAHAGDNKTLTPVRLKGSYFEIGQAWGAALGSDMKASLDSEIGWLSRFSGKEKADLIALAQKLLPVAQKYDPGFIEVMKGIPLDLAWHFTRLWSGVYPDGVHGRDPGCPPGAHIHGHEPGFKAETAVPVPVNPGECLPEHARVYHGQRGGGDHRCRIGGQYL
mgnify:CR=1 FL=1